MKVLSTALLPEIILAVTACALFLLGTSTRVLSRRLAGELALVAVILVFFIQCFRTVGGPLGGDYSGGSTSVYGTEFSAIVGGGAVHVQPFAEFVKLIASGVGALLILLNLPTDDDATGTSASQTGTDTAEFFGLLLLSLTGLMLVASANDLILLFLGIELASIPTYIMVSISRPLPIAQEAGLKYFFLGAMSAAVMLFGFSYLYGVTGTTSLDAITAQMAAAPAYSDWMVLAVLMLIAGFAFKMAAVPLHAYAGDVYTGAATPVTAFLSFVPKTSGFVALIKVLFAVGGGTYAAPPVVVDVLAAIAGLTMTFGNILALVQVSNLKRTFAYSSVAHSGYMLVGITALVASSGGPHALSVQSDAVQGVLFYLATYGLMNVAAFGVLQLLPSRHPKPATSAETYDDLAGQGRKHMGLGLAMAVACLSLAGVPATAGFLGKVYLTAPAARASLVGLSVTLWINAAIGAAYYLRVIATMFLRPEPTHLFGPAATPPPRMPQPATVVIAVFVSAVATVLIGAVPAVTSVLTDRVKQASQLDGPTVTSPSSDVTTSTASAALP
jgi:NADH-quinone oxidoreductase subunit N